MIEQFKKHRAPRLKELMTTLWNRRYKLGWEALNNPYMLLVARAFRRFNLNYQKKIDWVWKTWQNQIRLFHERKESAKHRALDRLAWASLSGPKKAMIKWYHFMWSERMIIHSHRMRAFFIIHNYMKKSDSNANGLCADAFMKLYFYT
jgi:hypothetical protein